MAKRFLKRALCVFTAIICAAPLFSCDKNTSTPTSSGFIVDKTGIEYVLSRSFSLYAVNKGEEYIAVNGEKIYTVEYEEPENFLCVEDSGEFLVYRRADLPEMTLDIFDPIAALIYNGQNTRWIASFYADDEYFPDEYSEYRGINESQDTEICQAIARAITEGERVEVPSESVIATNRYFIRLLSKKYPGLYYVVVFFGDDSGRFYLRDRSIDKTVVCPREVIARMIGYAS